MKTFRITSSLLFLSIAITSFGQLQTLKDRYFSKDTHFLLASGMKYENAMGNSSTVTSVPKVIHSIYAENIEVDYGADLEIEAMELEAWMTTPFEAEIKEEEMQLEAWMTTPFEAEIGEEEMELEPWMTTPFEAEIEEEVLELEAWMTTPFGPSLKKDSLVIENWMTIPYYAAR